MWIMRGGKKRSGGERLIEMNGGRGASTRTENIGVAVEGNGRDLVVIGLIRVQGVVAGAEIVARREVPVHPLEMIMYRARVETKGRLIGLGWVGFSTIGLDMREG